MRGKGGSISLQENLSPTYINLTVPLGQLSYILYMLVNGSQRQSRHITVKLNSRL